MLLLSKSFLVKRGDNLGDVTEFLKQEIGLDAFLIKEIHAESVNTEATRLTILYQKYSDTIVDNILPKRAGLYTSDVANSSFHAKLLFSSQIDPGTLTSGAIFIDSAAIPSSSMSILEGSNYYGVSVNLSSYIENGFHYLRVDRDVLKRIDSSKFEYSPIEGYVVHEQSSPHLGDELRPYKERIRGTVHIDVVRASKSSNIHRLIAETLSVKNIDPSSLLAFAQTRLDDNLLDIYYIYVNKPEPIIVDGFPLNNTFFPNASPPDKISFVFNSELDGSDIKSTSWFDIYSGYTSKSSISASDVTLLSDNRTVIIDTTNYIASPGAYCIVALSDIKDSKGNVKYKPEYWNIYVDSYVLGSFSGSQASGSFTGITGVQPFGGLNSNGSTIGITLGPGFRLPILPGSGITIYPGSGLVPPTNPGEAFHVRLDSTTLAFNSSSGITIANAGISGANIKSGELVRSVNSLHDNVLISGLTGVTGHVVNSTLYFTIVPSIYSLITGTTGSDPYTQYTRVDGTRPFTSTIGGIYPVSSGDLATKGYVDSQAAASGASSSAAYITWQAEAGLSNEKTLTGQSGIYVDLSTTPVSIAATFYGSFTGHTGSTSDVHSVYIITTPATSVRNTIFAQLDNTLLTLNPYIDQTADIFVSKNTASAKTVWIDSTGFINSITPLTSSNLTTKGYVDSATGTIRSLSYLTWNSESLLTGSKILSGLSGIYVDNSSTPVNISSTFYSAFTGHTGDSTLHFTQAAISITASQVSNFNSAVNSAIQQLSGDFTGVSGSLINYVLRDGTRSFTSTISGITPTLSAHLATKGYVDSLIAPLPIDSLVQYSTGASSNGNYTLSGAYGIYLYTGVSGFLIIENTGIGLAIDYRPFTGSLVPDSDAAYTIGNSNSGLSNLFSRALTIGDTPGTLINDDVTTTHVYASGDDSTATAIFVPYAGGTGPSLQTYTTTFSNAIVVEYNGVLSAYNGITMLGGFISGVASPTLASHATPKNYVDGAVSAVSGKFTGHTGDASIHFTMGSINHTGLTGLTVGDPHTQYIYKSPATTARNTITSTFDNVALTLIPWIDQTVNTFAIQESAGFTTTVWVTVAGYLSTSRTPVVSTDVVPKSYLDSVTGSLTGFYTTKTAFTGYTGSVGVLTGYVLRDGSRPFTSTISGITPSLADHLATKGYVDGLIPADLSAEPVVTWNTPTTFSDYATATATSGIAISKVSKTLYFGLSGTLFTGITGHLGNSTIHLTGDAGTAAYANIGTGATQVPSGTDPRFMSIANQQLATWSRHDWWQVATNGWTSATIGTALAYIYLPRFNPPYFQYDNYIAGAVCDGASATTGNNAVALYTNNSQFYLPTGRYYKSKIFIVNTGSFQTGRVGLWGNAATPTSTGKPDAGVWFEYAPTTSTSFYGYCRNSSGTTSGISIGINPTNGASYDLVFKLDGGSNPTIYFYELNTSLDPLATITGSSIPSTAQEKNSRLFFQTIKNAIGIAASPLLLVEHFAISSSGRWPQNP